MLVVAGASISVATLITNLGLLVCSSQLPRDLQTGAAIIYSGSSDTAGKVSTWSHLAINVVSTLPLGASNATLQYLCAPTRKEVCRTITGLL